MSAIGGILTGCLALGALELVVTTNNGTALFGLAAWPGNVARWWVDPNQPLIPDRRNATTKGLESALYNAYQKSAQVQNANLQTPAPGNVPAPAQPVTLRL